MNDEQLRRRAAALHLNGVVAHWPEVATAGWVSQLVEWEEAERTRRSMERRLKDARIGRFKPLADFDWKWPTRCDRGAIEGVMSLEFIAEAANVVLVGPNGVGKSTLVKNVAHQAQIRGHMVRFTTAGELLGDLAALDSDTALRRRLRHYAAPDLLVIGEIGYAASAARPPRRHPTASTKPIRRSDPVAHFSQTNKGSCRAPCTLIFATFKLRQISAHLQSRQHLP